MAINPFSSGSTYTGYAQYSETSSTSGAWDRCHDAEGNTASTGSTASAGWGEGVSWDRYLRRGFIGFDTSGIPDTAIITDAYIKITGTEYWRNRANDFVIGSGTQSSTIANSDYEDHVTTTNYGTWTKISSGSGFGSNNFSATQVDLNTAGRSSINKTGYTVFSWRDSTDQADTGSFSSDSYNYVNITSATLYVAYQSDEEKDLTETITVTDTLKNVCNKILTEAVSITAWIVGHGTEFIKTLTEAVTIAATNVSKKVYDYTKTLTETISIMWTARYLVNGLVVDYWNKVASTVSSWTKEERTDTEWTNTPTPSGESEWTE